MKATFGRYVEGTSFIHRLDARAKILSITIYTMLLFLANNFLTMMLLLTTTFMIFRLTDVSLRYIFGSIRYAVYMVLFAFVLHLLTTKTGSVLLDFGMIKIYKDAVIQGFYMGIRLILILGLSSILTITTPPIQITDALESLCKPFQKIGFPIHEMALMLSLALRFIPTLSDEMKKVSKAQAARGIDIKSPTIALKERIQLLPAFLIPLFIQAFRRADELAVAMEARGYEAGCRRTKIRYFTWQVKDTFTLGCIVVFGICLYFLRT